MLLITILLLTMVVCDIILVIWFWWKTRSRGDDQSGTDPDSNADCGCPLRDKPPADKTDNRTDRANDVQRPFLVQPYLQVGNNPQGHTQRLEILWNAESTANTRWDIRIRFAHPLPGRSAQMWRKPLWQAINIQTVPDHYQFRTLVEDLVAGETFAYDVYRNGELVFTAEAKALKAAGSPYRLVIVGDSGHGQPGQKKVAHQIAKFSPDLIVMPGDIAYKRGLFSEYMAYHFPIFNSDEDAPDKGAPLLRSIPSIACPGNHDFGRPELWDVPNFDEYPDLFGYFSFWSLPLNGPDVSSSGNFEKLIGEEQRQKAFLAAAGERFPRMGNYSFNFANAHFTVLDANFHMDWSNAELRKWLEQDLAASTATWKWVVLHQPPFSSHQRHGKEQRARQIVPIFERAGVDIVACGHAHWYERSYPLRFHAKSEINGVPVMVDGAVEGTFDLDHSFDGGSNVRPQGVVYLVSGAGGAKLQGSDLPETGALPFTHKLSRDKHSFTVMDVDGSSLTVRQISEDGEELDHFCVSK